MVFLEVILFSSMYSLVFDACHIPMSIYYFYKQETQLFLKKYAKVRKPGRWTLEPGRSMQTHGKHREKGQLQIVGQRAFTF